MWARYDIPSVLNATLLLKLKHKVKYMKKYNIQYAISIRHKTFRSIGYADPEIMNPKDWDKTIDFRTSCEIARFEPEAPDIPLHVDVLIHTSGWSVNIAKLITKKLWKKHYRTYRLYCQEVRLNQQPPML